MFTNNYLINCSNIKNGGGLQVAQSICAQLGRYQQHHFIVVLSTYIGDVDIVDGPTNCEEFHYNIKNNVSTLLFGRDSFLDGLIEKHNIDAVLTIFGPSRWRPRVPHLCGFARAQLLLENPLAKELTWKEKLLYKIWRWGFKNSGDTFYTENKYISDMLPNLLGDVKVYTVTNYYNQIFDQQKKWKRTHRLSNFDGITCLSVSSPSSHKNFPIIIDIIRVLRQRYPEFKVRFVLTFDSECLQVPEDMRENFVFVGKVDVSECPYLYEQADIMFMPTLMECFTATYPEAMRMEVPIVTTDLEFARGLCGDAACYYSAIDAESAAEAIYRVATDKEYTARLVENGKKQLLTYDNYEERADKLINILEEIAK